MDPCCWCPSPPDSLPTDSFVALKRPDVRFSDRLVFEEPGEPCFFFLEKTKRGSIFCLLNCCARSSKVVLSDGGNGGTKTGGKRAVTMIWGSYGKGFGDED